MKFSVLIAAHRAAASIADSLTSVREQSHNEWELIVAEYGSADTTESILREFAQTSGHSVTYRNLGYNHNSASVRNYLLSLATGDYVIFLEPGDTWMPEHLANAVSLSTSNSDIVVSGALTNGRKNGSDIVRLVSGSQLLSNPARTLFSRNVIPTNSCVAFGRAFAHRVGMFDDNLVAGEDRDFWFRCALAGARFKATNANTCQTDIATDPTGRRTLLAAESAVQFYEKHADVPAVPSALRRRLLAATLVTLGRLLRSSDTAKAARCFWRAWSLQPVYIQTLGQFALTGWRSTTENFPHERPETAEPFETGSLRKIP